MNGHFYLQNQRRIRGWFNFIQKIEPMQPRQTTMQTMNFTARIQNAYSSMMQTMDNEISEILYRIIQTQASVGKISELVDAHIQKCKTWASDTTELYIMLDLGELFRIGLEKDLWVKHEGYQLHFGLSRDAIRTNRTWDRKKELIFLYEDYFKQHVQIKQFMSRLQIFFPDARVHPGHCRWYESSGNVVFCVSVSVNLTH